MRILAAAMLMMTLSGCMTVVTNDSALIDGLRGPMTSHAAALAGDDVTAMRRTGRVVIAKFDAGAG